VPERRGLSTGLQAQRDFAEAIERGFQIFDDFGGDLVGGRQQVGVVERVVLEPEDIEIELVAGDELGMGKATEAFGPGALVAPPRLVAGDEIIEIGAVIGRSFKVKRWFVRRS
jgi:hypothetical protein